MSTNGLGGRNYMQRPIRGQKPNFVIYGWILMFKVSKNASFQNESFCMKHFLIGGQLAASGGGVCFEAAHGIWV